MRNQLLIVFSTDQKKYFKTKQSPEMRFDAEDDFIEISYKAVLGKIAVLFSPLVIR